MISNMLLEDDRRMAARPVLPDPRTGDPDDPARVAVLAPGSGGSRVFVPRTMVEDPLYPAAMGTESTWQRLRCAHDFEYWAATCASIKDKSSSQQIPFVLNRPQRRLLAVLEADRRAGRPIRVIILKARQWGCSTLVQLYMAWMQICIHRNWHSAICAQVKDAASTIRGMYSRLLANYPEHMWAEDEKPKFRPFEKSQNVSEVAGRGCHVTVSSIENYDALRGSDIAMAHLTEVAFWRNSPQRSADDLISAVEGSVALIPDSLVAMESTANGVGNFFHSEWLRARDGSSGKRAVFVPWYEIDIYRLAPPDREAFAASLSEYEMNLFEHHGCTLDQIYWYRSKRRSYRSARQMMAEYPTDDLEAFCATGAGVFDQHAAEALRSDCREPQTGEVEHGRWVARHDGRTALWQLPDPEGEYVAAVDVGGRSEKADWSVIAVMRVDTPRPEIVAQWRGHTDYDILASRAAALGSFYRDAYLIVESNTLETAEAGRGLAVLDHLAESYPNLYRRTTFDTVGQSESSRIGFHTNRATKEVIITDLIAAVRDGTYVERDSAAVNEMLSYEQTPSGSYAARIGSHDDILMTRALALHAAKTAPPPSRRITHGYIAPW